MRTNGERISVVMPTRDRAGFVEAALESLLAQTIPPHQIALVDDGSSREHAESLRSLAARHPNLVELHRSPRARGAAAARNVGLAHAHGDFVVFLDDDDLLHPRFFEDGLAVLRDRRDADAVVFLYDCVVSAADEGPRANPVPARFLEERPASSFLRYLIPIHTCLVRRARIGECRFPEHLRQGEDTYFWIALASRGCRFVADPRVYGTVRRHGGNLTRSRAEYVSEIQACYEALIADGLIADRRDLYLAHLKLLWMKLASRQTGWGTHFRNVVAQPHLLAHELAFWSANLLRRRRETAAARAA